MDFSIKAVWTDEITTEEIEDFIHAHRTTFQSSYSPAYFTHKYLQNPYGPSLIILAYSDKSEIAAARAFWRNDIDGAKAYQAVDTCTVPSFQRMGLFRLTTETALKELPEDSFIYNYPNRNSKPQYMKYGWTIQKECYNRFFIPMLFRKENRTKIDCVFLDWWVKYRLAPRLAYMKSFGRYYLLRQMNAPGRYEVISEIDRELTEGMPKAKPKVLTYMSNHHSFYNNKNAEPFFVVSRNLKEKTDIPIWKVDAL